MWSFEKLKTIEVIDINTGEKLGFIDDVEVNIRTAETVAFIIYGRRFLLSREEDIIIPCEGIRVVGNDVMLVSIDKNCIKRTKRPFDFFKRLFG